MTRKARRTATRASLLVGTLLAGGLLGLSASEAAGVLPPWKRSPAIAAGRGDAALVARQWAAADNRASCAPLAFSSVRVGTDAPARARAAYFGGGWGVAYDLPGHRSAFGIAGAGVRATPKDIIRWPDVRRWSDGSAAGWGLEGDQGPGHLAYIRVAGQSCLYNLWSDLGEGHLRRLMGQLRRVAVRVPAPAVREPAVQPGDPAKGA
jgi:hypothetical protein